MRRRTKILVGVGAGALVLSGATAFAFTGDDHEDPIRGAALQSATDAALAHTGGGRVTDTEVGDEESYYEVEVTLDDGTMVDVQLDEQFEVVGSSPDEDEPGDED